MYWIEQVERLTRRTIIENHELRDIILDRCYAGELAELPEPTYPLICFKMEPVAELQGYVSGRINFWVWCEAGDPRLYDIFEMVKDLFDNECLIFEDSAYRKVHIVYKVGEPIRNVQPKFSTQVLNSIFTFRGLDI